MAITKVYTKTGDEGKTLVALMAMLIAIDNGFQAVMMAPTEILAEQHLATIKDFLFLLTETSAYRIHGRTYRPLSISRHIRYRSSALSAPAVPIRL